MNSGWRFFRTALRQFPRLSTAIADEGLSPSALRYVPAAALATGAIGAGVYWVSSQLWPTSVAVVLSMAATTVIAGRWAGSALGIVFCVLIKYNALMALSAANVPLALPPYLGLGLIMLCGFTASGAVQTAVLKTKSPTAAAAARASPPAHAPYGSPFFWILGLAPALLLGIPGLTGLAAAIVTGLGIGRLTKPFALAQPAIEAAFYLGALAVWRYV